MLRPVIQAEVAAAQGRQAAAEGRPAEAARYLALAAAHIPDRAVYWEQAGQFAWVAGDPHSAIHYLQRAEAIEDLSIDGWIALGDSYQRTGEIAAATAAWEQAISRGGDPRTLYEQLSEIYQSEGNYSKLYLALKNLAQVQPSPETFLQLGLLGAIFEPDAAFAYLTRAAELDPALAEPSEEMQRAIRRARLIDEDPAFLFTAVGRSLAAMGEWELAAQSFERAIEVNPAYAEAWAFLGEAQHKNGQEPLAALEQAYTLAPDSIAVNTFYALYWQRRGQPGRAVRLLQTAADQDPDNPALMAELGSAVAAAGDLETGLQLFLQAVAVEPQNIVFWRLLAGFSIANDLEIEEIGLPAARQAHFLDPADAAAIDLIGRSYMSLGNSVLAERFLLDALRVDPAYAPASLHLGMLYIGTGKTMQAREQLERVLVLAPDSTFSEQAERLLTLYIP